MLKLDGKLVSQKVRDELAEEVKTFQDQPCLAVVLVGEDPASQVYVKNKLKACEAAGIESKEYRLPAESSYEDLKQVIERVNLDDSIHGLLVQLPLPKHLNETQVMDLIAPEKDADGLSAVNMGLLAQKRGEVTPCTPTGVMEMLKHYEISLEGKEAVVVGRSSIVGVPMGQLLLQANATVTMCHSRSQNMAEHLKRADVVVVAAGQPEFLSAKDFKKGAVVVDVGIHRKPEGKGLCGDVKQEGLEDVLSAHSPVPGGVGPMTIAFLLKNTVTLYRKAKGLL